MSESWHYEYHFLPADTEMASYVPRRLFGLLVIMGTWEFELNFLLQHTLLLTALPIIICITVSVVHCTSSILGRMIIPTKSHPRVSTGWSRSSLKIHRVCTHSGMHVSSYFFCPPCQSINQGMGGGQFLQQNPSWCNGISRHQGRNCDYIISETLSIFICCKNLCGKTVRLTNVVIAVKQLQWIA